MKYISTTDLRTKSSELVRDLKLGERVMLVHRSEVVGIIEPPTVDKGKPTQNALQHFLALAHLQKGNSHANPRDAYEEHLREKYG